MSSVQFTATSSKCLELIELFSSSFEFVIAAELFGLEVDSTNCSSFIHYWVTCFFSFILKIWVLPPKYFPASFPLIVNPAFPLLAWEFPNSQSESLRHNVGSGFVIGSWSLYQVGNQLHWECKMLFEVLRIVDLCARVCFDEWFCEFMIWEGGMRLLLDRGLWSGCKRDGSQLFSRNILFINYTIQFLSNLSTKNIMDHAGHPDS